MLYYDQTMTRNKSLLLAVVSISVLLVGAFLVYHKSFVPSQVAAAIVGTETSTHEVTQVTAPREDLIFSNEPVSNIVSKDATKDTSDNSSPTITIETEIEDKTPPTDLVVEKSYSDSHEVSSSVSYKYDTNTVINAIQTLSNEARAKEHLFPLVFDSKLAQLAIDRSTDMAKNNYLSHTTLDGCDLECRFKNSGYDTIVWGENLAEYEPYTVISANKLAQEFVKKWLQSSGHRRNLMSSEFTHEGIGVTTSGNRIVVTVIFAKP